MAGILSHLGTPKKLLDPIERISEVLFGLIMVLTYTSAITPGGQDEAEAVREMLVGALGCNVAWGLIDAVFYLMGCRAAKTKGLISFRAVRAATDPKEAQRIISDALPPVLNAILKPAEVESIHQRLKGLPEPPKGAQLGREELLGAFWVFWLVFIITFPVAIPFMFMHSVEPALLVSNAVGMALLFGVGCAYGQTTARNPWVWGLVMVIVGAAMVALCKALGG